jgi:integrase/recombinase XerD
MDHTTDAGHSAGHYRDDLPFAEERNRYLRYFADGGATPTSIRIKRKELLWIAMRLGPGASSSSRHRGTSTDCH